MKDFEEDNKKDELIFGTRAVIEAVHAGREFDRVFIQDRISNPLIRELKDELKKANILYQLVPLPKLNRLTTGNHQGVVAFVSSIEYADLHDVVAAAFESGRPPLLIILDRITDTRNFGAIARTALCCGAHGIIIPSRGAAPVNGEAIKVSAGALNTLPVVRENNLKLTLEFLKESGISIVACTEKGKEYIYNAELNKPLAIIMGSEENGVSEEYLKRSDMALKIPLSGPVGSFNVSVAAGMILYEALKQRIQRL